MGLLVPNCLVAPGRGARKLKVDDVPWLREGLRDPTVSAELPGTQWSALYDWLGSLHDLLCLPEVAQRGAAMREEIRLFAQACESKLAAAGVEKRKPHYQGADAALPNPFYAPLLNTPYPLDDGPSECIVNLPAPANLTVNGTVSGFILADPAIADRTLQRAPQNVRVWGKHSLGSLDQRGARSAAIEGAQREGFLVLAPDDLFTAKLVHLNDKAKVNAHGLEWENFLLPISPLVLFMVKRDSLVAQLGIADRGDRFEVRLTIELKPAVPLARAPRHTIVKSYDKKTDVIFESIGEDLVLWPDKATSNWPWNFLRFSYNPALQLAPRFAASADSLAEIVQLRARRNRDEGIAVLRALSTPTDTVFERQDRFFQGNVGEMKSDAGKLIAYRFRFSQSADGIGEQHLLGFGADAVFFAADPDGRGDSIPAGCMILPERRTTQSQTRAEISVDFGTTNTVVYIKVGDETERMVFEERVTRPLAGRSAEQDQFAIDCVEFFPAAGVSTPFPTVMYQRQFDLAESGTLQAASSTTYHGTNDNIFFMPEVSDKFGFAIDRNDRKQLVFNLKWSKEAAERLMVQRFLRQIVLMSTIEAMAKGVSPARTRWHFSYPQAWKSPQIVNFRSYVSGAWQDIMQPILGGTTKPSDFIDYETEGAAALRYFTGSEHLGQTSSLILMFDIGGGTTEIAIYLHEQTIWRGSFRIAGGDFFTQFFAANLDVIEKIRDDENQGTSFQDAVRRAGGRGKDSKDFVELYISQPHFDRNFSRSYPAFSDEPAGVALRNVAVVALSGLFYYAGMVLRNAVAKEKVKERDLSNITLAFAGRGSTFFRHLGDAEDNDSVLGQMAKIIPDVIRTPAKSGDRVQEAPSRWAESGVRGHISALFSAYPKHEVARGMLPENGESSRQSTGKQSKVILEDIPLGENVTLDTPDGRSTLISEQAVGNVVAGSHLVEIGDTEFSAFVDLLTLHVGLHIDLESQGGKAHREIENIARQEFTRALAALGRDGEQKEQAEGALEIVPPFISKLRQLVKILARGMEDRKKLVSVRNSEPR